MITKKTIIAKNAFCHPCAKDESHEGRLVHNSDAIQTLNFAFHNPWIFTHGRGICCFSKSEYFKHIIHRLRIQACVF